MHVSYGKPTVKTVNDGKEWERGGCGCRATTVNRTLSRGSTRSKIAYFSVWKKSLLYDTRISRYPQLLGQDFVVNFASYTRVYTVLILCTFPGFCEMGFGEMGLNREPLLVCFVRWHRWA